MSAHRYWRLLTGNNGGGSNGVSIAELHLRTTIGGSSVATGGTASASSIWSGSAANAFDGNASTMWEGVSHTSDWLQYDFGAGNDKDIVEYAITFPGSSRFTSNSPNNWTLQYSDDGSTWTTKFTTRGEASWPINTDTTKVYSADHVPDDGASKTFWRISVTATSHVLCAIVELQMFVSGNVTNQCTGGQGYADQLGDNKTVSIAFDGSLSPATSYWAANSNTTWIGYKFASATDIALIAITARDFPSQSPKDFTIEYWNGSSYTTWATITGETGWTNGETRYYNASGRTSAPAAAVVRPVVFVCC